MRGVRVLFAAVAGFAGIAAFSGVADAGSKNIGGGWAVEYDSGIDIVPFGVAGNFTSVSIEKLAHFTQGPVDGFINPLKITFYQVSAQATPFVKIHDEFVTNDTGVDWTGFRFILESDGISGGVKFDTAQSAGFNINPFTTKEYDSSLTELKVGGGVIPDAPGSSLPPADEWRPGDVSANLVIDANPFKTGNFRQVFRLKEQPLFGSEQPLIPLPTAAWSGLSGLVGLGFVSLAKRFRRAN